MLGGVPARGGRSLRGAPCRRCSGFNARGQCACDRLLGCAGRSRTCCKKPHVLGMQGNACGRLLGCAGRSRMCLCKGSMRVGLPAGDCIAGRSRTCCTTESWCTCPTAAAWRWTLKTCRPARCALPVLSALLLSCAHLAVLLACAHSSLLLSRVDSSLPEALLILPLGCTLGRRPAARHGTPVWLHAPPLAPALRLSALARLHACACLPVGWRAGLPGLSQADSMR